LFPGFPFLPSKQAHALSRFGANFQPLFSCFDGYGLILNLSGNKRIGEFKPETCIHTHATFLAGKAMAKVQPPTHTLDPKLNKFYAEVLHLCIETIG
jgi:hypothetical protein